MSIYTKNIKQPTEMLAVDSCSRITSQKALFLNPTNVYWG